MRKEDSDNRLGDIIKAARLSKGWTQSRLAETLEITPRYLKYIESNGRSPSLNLLERIVLELDIPSDKIFRSENEREPPQIYVLRGGKLPG